MLDLRWSTAADIWWLGAAMSFSFIDFYVRCTDCMSKLRSLIWGRNYHISKLPGISFTDEAWNLHVMIQQARYFEPFPQSYQDWVTEDHWETLKGVVEYVNEDGLRKPFHMLEDEELTAEDKMFLCKIMRMDPRDRPPAKELLEDEWFTELSSGAQKEANA